MKKLLVLFLALGLVTGFNSVAKAQKQVERLDRGAIAVRHGNGYIVSWRLLGDEPYEMGFNVYRGGTKLNSEPVTAVTSYTDDTAPLNSYYYVKAIVNGMEVDNKKPARILNQTEGANAGYFDIPLDRPNTGVNGGTYSPNDASTGDLNGDGEYDIVLKWNPSNAKDNSQSGTTDNVYLDGYTMDGQKLWRIDLGPNIRAGAHYTQFLVYDFDGNGKAEIMCKTAPGTRDGSGNYLSKGPASTADHSKIYRNGSGYILSGPEYISVFDGETGLELATTDYWPQRGTVKNWGDSYGNRVDRFNAIVAYVDGQRPSGVFQRGYYTRMTFAAWNWRDGQLTRAWTFDSNTAGNGKYYGQGNHSLNVIDANGDGLHDIVTGSAVISGTGEGLETSGFGHGDACHTAYMIKDDPRPMIFMCHEEDKYGVSLRYADTGEMIFRIDKSGDIGRGCAAELDPNSPGFKFWAASGMGLYDLNGTDIGSNPNSINFVIWWDGKLSRDLMNSNTIDQWHVVGNYSTRLLTGDNTSSNNGTKATPTLQADLFGDWREEVILRVNSDKALRVFTSTMPTEYKLYTFMHDPVYRCDIAGQNSSYNQPPHPGFYVASDMDFPPPQPDIIQLSGVYRGTGDIIKDLMVSDFGQATNWEIGMDLEESVSAYGNKSLFPSPLPEKLVGAEWIKTSTGSNTWNEEGTLAKFEVSKDAVISIFVDKSLEETPEWLSGYTKEDYSMNVSSALSGSIEMQLYDKEVKQGEIVELGANSVDGNADYQMYFVVATEKNTTAVLDLDNNRSLKVYPNPCNEQTNIEYHLKTTQHISLGLYDINGKLNKTIDKGLKSAGMHKIKINDPTIKPGIYLLKLVAHDKVQQKKILFTK